MTYPYTAIISDLHGNVPALTVALADAHERGAERFVCLGDVVGYGSEPRPCLDIIMELCVASGTTRQEGDERGVCLMGNHEEALMISAEDFNPKARAAIEWTKDEINVDPKRADAYWNFLGQLLPKAHDEIAMFAHGSPRNPVREYMLPRDIQDEEKMNANFACMDRPVCFVGHSHVPCVYFEDGRYFLPKGTDGPYDLGLPVAGEEPDPTGEGGSRAIVNVGSVGQPRDGDPRLSYVMFDGRALTFVRLEYDHGIAAERIRAVPELPDFLADRLAAGR